MIRLLSDENLNGDISRGILLRNPVIDLVRVQDVGLMEVEDPPILEWAATNKRILLTHDRATVPGFAYARVIAGQKMPGVFVLNDRISIQRAISEILTIDACSEQAEWENLVVYLPL
jgi:predicted nuclease of predicted toxin-antitoxin system